MAIVPPLRLHSCQSVKVSKGSSSTAVAIGFARGFGLND